MGAPGSPFQIFKEPSVKTFNTPQMGKRVSDTTNSNTGMIPFTSFNKQNSYAPPSGRDSPSNQGKLELMYSSNKKTSMMSGGNSPEMNKENIIVSSAQTSRYTAGNGTKRDMRYENS